MSDRRPSLADKFDLAETRQLLSGAQAIVRLVLMQKARDAAAGLHTAGYVTGYRGSPIATLEAAFERAGGAIPANDIVFHPAINEDLAATAIWGSQQAELRGEGKFDGVFAVWYGKGPGVDRSGDVLRHANHAGTSRHGGVVALMGDDHTCESSTSAHQSEFALVDAMIPILNPSGVQEILDYGLTGFALSRYAGVWVGLKCVKDNMESTAVVDARADRLALRLPDESAFAMPPGGLNIRLQDPPLAKEARLHDHKRAAVLAFARANRLDRVIVDGGAQPRIGIVTTGKSYLDTRQALDMLGLDAARAAALGLALYKVALVWPLEPQGLARFAQRLETILVVEEKRSLIETQVKEQLFDSAVRPRVLGKRDEEGRWLFPAKGALDPLDIAIAIGRRLAGASGDAALAARVAELERLRSAPPPAEAFHRIPYFCAGCPHNTSTRVPDGARAYAGIGCHYMAQWMDRSTEGFTQMGGEGANWVGEAPFSKREHVFQNIGDGTFIHSGSLAIRAAIAAGTRITFKLLYNDAVAMTGGQPLEGGMSVAQMAGQLLAEGARRVAVVTDDPTRYRAGTLPSRVELHHRRDLDAVQRALAAVDGTTVLIYDQTCAAEKRRRRKRGALADPPLRAFIDPEVCEGCGDCGVKSNCVAILPHETPLGRKRAIDQSACNKDLSCIEGFCPSFVTLKGATVRKRTSDRRGLPALAEPLPEPTRPDLERPYAMLATGIGGTGVVTVSAVLAEAAYLAGLGFGAIDATGLAQKGGAVACHMRVAARQEDIHAIRVGTTGADLVLGGDLVVAASAKVLDAIAPDRTALVYSPHEVTTGDFTRDPALTVPRAELQEAIRRRAGSASVTELDTQALSLALFGDTLYANMVLLGAAYQQGHVPIAASAIEQAIAVNGAAVETNRDAFRAGRLAVHAPDKLAALALPAEQRRTALATLADRVAFHARDIEAYQDAALAERYRSRLARIAETERTRTPGRAGLAEATADAYRKLLMVKDEYEVARLLTDGRLKALLDEHFEGVKAITLHMAPPLIAPRDKSTGHPRKLRLAGWWALPVLRLLARLRGLRGSWADLFGYTEERRRQHRRITDYEHLLDEIADRLSPETHATAVALAALPLEVKGYGHVEAASHARMKAKEADLLAALRGTEPARAAAE
ncbi:MAG: indolepyruvate ferredoxin oxidoreductase family protein [Pseudomonadota bacterium]